MARKGLVPDGFPVDVGAHGGDVGRFYADLHIHSKYSRATSADCNLEQLAYWACRKGISVVGTGDFTHPAWFAEIKEKLVPAEEGLFRLRDDVHQELMRRVPDACQRPVRFMLSVEISTIYKKGDRTRKVHHLVYAPDFETVERFNQTLGRIGNIVSDGRPILGLDSRHLLEIALESGEGAYLVPAHIWTPWFAVLGSKSGFDSVTECYGDLASHVFAVETGLSSDPPMNWRISSLDRYRLMSNSDAHSPGMLGREACVFHSAMDYWSMKRALETGEEYGGTIEFFPEEGKYHLDGHRKCNVRWTPEETERHAGKCSVCGDPITVGVLNRVEALADRSEGEKPEGAISFQNLIQLPEMMGEIHGVGPKSKTVTKEMESLVNKLGPELQILQELPLDVIAREGSPLLGEAISRMRKGEVYREAGFDGEYGVIRAFDPSELRRKTSVGFLFDEPNDVPLAKEVNANNVQDVSRCFKKYAPSSDTKETVDEACGVGLDPEQQRAASIVTGPLLIVAGPGTGKTRTLMHRLSSLVEHHGVLPEQCLAITFTRRAADEMRERLQALAPAYGSKVFITTFHGLGWSIVEEQRAILGLHRGTRVADEIERLNALILGAPKPLTFMPIRSQILACSIARIDK